MRVHACVFFILPFLYVSPPPLFSLYPLDPLALSRTLSSHAPSPGLEARVDDIASRIPMAELPNLFSDVTVGVPSLNIPQYNWWSEALHGTRDHTHTLTHSHSTQWCSPLLVAVCVLIHMLMCAMPVMPPPDTSLGVSRCAYDRTKDLVRGGGARPVLTV